MSAALWKLNHCNGAVLFDVNSDTIRFVFVFNVISESPHRFNLNPAIVRPNMLFFCFFCSSQSYANYITGIQEFHKSKTFQYVGTNAFSLSHSIVLYSVSTWIFNEYAAVEMFNAFTNTLERSQSHRWANACHFFCSYLNTHDSHCAKNSTLTARRRIRFGRYAISQQWWKKVATKEK